MIRSYFPLIRSCVLTAAVAVSAYCVDIPPEKLKPFAPLPEVATAEKYPVTEERVQLGYMLYFEPRISATHKVSCNTCHDLEKYGIDGLKTSRGIRGQFGPRNAPTVY